MITNCVYCGTELVRKPCRFKKGRNFCNGSCQLKYDYENENIDKKTMLKNAHNIIRTKGHYKRDNTYLKKRNPGSTPEARLKISKANLGSKNGMFGKIPWNKMFPTKKWFQEKEFKELRKLCLERDDYKCIKCGKKTQLFCDHIIPYRICKEHNLDNLQMLCGFCHSKKTVKDVKIMKKSGYI